MVRDATMFAIEKRKRTSLTAAGNGSNPQPRSHVCRGEFSHVAVRSCASRTGETFVHKPRLLRPSITLTSRERSQRGKLETGREGCESTMEKRKLTLKFQGDAFLHCILYRFHFPSSTKKSISFTLFNKFKSWKSFIEYYIRVQNLLYFVQFIFSLCNK